jgi:hypothetical protein
MSTRSTSLGATWGDLGAVRPDIAAAGRRLLYSFGIGLGFLATVRVDGGPRVHPICPVLTESGLYGMIVPGPKLEDLRRDPRYALHGETYPPPHQDDAFYVTGIAVEVTDPALWERIASQMLAERNLTDRWPGFEAQVLFEFRVDRCLVTLTQAADGLPAGHSVWHYPDNDRDPTSDIPAR